MAKDIIKNGEVIGFLDWYCKHETFDTREAALEAVEIADLDTAGMTWNGEMYFDRETMTEYWPVYECEHDENGEMIQAHILGYKEGY